MSDQTTAPVPEPSADGQPAVPAPEQAASAMPAPAHEAATSPVEEIIEDTPAAETVPTIETAPAEPAAPETAPVPTPAPTEPEIVIQGAPERDGDKIDAEPTQQPIFTEDAPDTSAAPVPAEATPAAPQTEPQSAVISKPSDLPTTGKRSNGLALDKGEKMIAALGYIGILALIPLLLRRDSEFCRHHGPQALVVFVILMLAEIIGRLFGFVLPWFHAFTIIVMLVAWLVGFMLAFQGQWFRIPTIFEWSRQLNLFAKEASNEERLKNDNE